MIKISHLDLYNGEKWFITFEYNNEYYHSHYIDELLSIYTDLKYSDIALEFGAYIDDEHDEEEVFFEYEKDCIRCVNFLKEIINGV